MIQMGIEPANSELVPLGSSAIEMYKFIDKTEISCFRSRLLKSSRSIHDLF